MTIASYRSFTGTGAQNYERYFVPAIATPASASLLDVVACRPASGSSTSRAAPASCRRCD
jgi:hypothetical protein